MNLTGFQDCTICAYFEYKADGSAVSPDIAKLSRAILLIMMRVGDALGCGMPLHPVGQNTSAQSLLGAQPLSIHPTGTWHMPLSDMGMESMLVCRSGLLALTSCAVDSCVVESP